MTISKKIILAAVTALLLAAGCNNSASNQTAMNMKSKLKPNQKIKLKVRAAKAVDAKGNPLVITSQFSTSDKYIYVVASLQNAQKNDVISYIRYYNNKFIDARNSRINSNKTRNFYFSFYKPTGYPQGAYLVKVYYNKKYFGQVPIMVQ